ncbi:MAG: hypothetical protein K8R52_01275, partial [Bacteroidales bacterium]|nr:hypothetical protein [Bacteroidales bacterium]
MRHILFSLFISTLILPLVAQPFQIVPQPQKTELLQGDGLAFGNLTNLKMTGKLNRPVMGDILSQLTESYVSGSGTLTLKLDSTGI